MDKFNFNSINDIQLAGEGLNLPPPVLGDTPQADASSADHGPRQLPLTLFHNVHQSVGVAASLSIPELKMAVRNPLALGIPKLKHPVWGFFSSQSERRTKASVKAVGSILFDFDASVPPEHEFVERVGLALPGVLLGIHSTLSATEMATRWRIIAPLSRDVSPKEFSVLWGLLSDLVKGQGLAPDEACKDVGRVSIVPAVTRQGFYVSHWIEGDLIPVDQLLTAAEHVRSRGGHERTAIAWPSGHEARVRIIVAECMRVRHAVKGTRNSQLNKSVYRVSDPTLGLSLEEVTQMILPSALAAGLTESEANSTIYSAFSARQRGGAT